MGVLALPENPSEFIRAGLIYVPVGAAAAFLGNISAVGGGIVFIPAMMFIFHLPPVLALKVALGSQSIGMTSGAFAWLRVRKLPLEALKYTVPGLLLGSLISSVVIHPNPLLIKVIFGPVSIGLGILTLVLQKHKYKSAPGTFTLPPGARLPLLFTSVVGGLVTGWVAIGEGELIAALLMLAYGMDVAGCIGLGVLLLSINSVFLMLIHQFHLGGIPWEIVTFTGIGCVFGARLAPFVGRKFDALRLQRIFAMIAIADGVLFIFQFLFLKLAH